MEYGMRAFISQDPYAHLDNGRVWNQRGYWPCKWVWLGGVDNTPAVVAFRKQFTMPGHSVVRAHVTADERYELFLDGRWIGSGSERGDRENWFFETYDISLSADQHTMVAVARALGSKSPYYQHSVRPGFLFSPEGDYADLLGTGVTNWDAKKIEGYRFLDTPLPWLICGVGAGVVIDGKDYPWGVESGKGDNWKPADILHPGVNALTGNEVPHIHLLKPATLPPMLHAEARPGKTRFVSANVYNQLTESDILKDEISQWDLLLRDQQLVIPAGTTRRVIIDLDDYYCAYPEITVSGGAGSSISITWAEALYDDLPTRPPEKGVKGDRNAVIGKSFVGIGDTFLPDGSRNRQFRTLDWRAGRYVELRIEVGDYPVTIHQFKLYETRYPLEMEGSFASSEPRLEKSLQVMLRGLQMCSHETYMDCPYYERLMYAGDARLESLVTYVISHDDRLPRKALKMFDVSRLNSGLTQSRYPSRVRQVIPPFSLWWIGMIHDFALWRDDQAFVKNLMPGVRAVLDCFLGYINSDGLIECPKGWNFVDWVPDWTWGTPPDADSGVSGIINWHATLALVMASELEDYVGEPEMTLRWRRYARELSALTAEVFWDNSRMLFADDLSKMCFSEHSQCLAILTGLVGKDRMDMLANSLITSPDIARATVYFSHYLFEAYREIGQAERLFDKLGLWMDFPRIGLKTTPEEPEPSRSDCHAWGAHPIYHIYSTLLGIRPAGFGFREILIEPCLGPLTSVRGQMPHPNGFISVKFDSHEGMLRGEVELPESTSGSFISGASIVPLRQGRQIVNTYNQATSNSRESRK